VAEGTPVLMAWEDLHCADPTTLETRGMLIEQAPTAALLAVSTYRPELTPPWPQRSHMCFGAGRPTEGLISRRLSSPCYGGPMVRNPSPSSGESLRTIGPSAAERNQGFESRPLQR